MHVLAASWPFITGLFQLNLCVFIYCLLRGHVKSSSNTYLQLLGLLSQHCSGPTMQLCVPYGLLARGFFGTKNKL